MQWVKRKKKKKEKKVKGLVCWLLDVTSHSLFTRGLFKQTNAALFCLNTKPKTNSNYYWPVDGIHYGWKRSNPSKMNLVFFFFRSGTESESSDINAKWNRVGWTGIKYAPKHKKKKIAPLEMISWYVSCHTRAARGHPKFIQASKK